MTGRVGGPKDSEESNQRIGNTVDRYAITWR